MTSRFTRAACLALILAAVQVPGHADPIAVAPPFDDAYGYGSCGTVTLGSCTADALADVEGPFRLSIDVEGPYDGSIPSPGDAYAFATYSKGGYLPKAVARIDLTVTIHIDKGHALRAGGLPGGRGSMFADLWIGVGSQSCDCYDSDFRELLVKGDSIEDEEVTVDLTIINHRGGKVSPGSLQLYIDLYGVATLGGYIFVPLPDTGSASLLLEGAIESVTATITP